MGTKQRKINLFPAYQGKICIYLFTCGFLTLFFYLWIASFLFPNSDIVNYSVPISLFLFAVWLGIFYLALKLGCAFDKKLSQRRQALVMLAVVLAFLPLQYIVFFSCYYQPGWDVSILTESGHWLALNMGIPTNYHEYFACYPNNVTLLMIWAYIDKLGQALFSQGYDYLFGAVMLSALMGDLALWLSWHTARRMEGSGPAMAVFFAGIPLIAFAPWMTNPYSDTMTLLFPLAAFCLFFQAMQIQKRILRVLCAVGCGLCVGIGMLIKPTVFIVAIALAIGWLFCAKNKKALVQAALLLALMAMGIVAVVLPGRQLCTQVMVKTGVTEEHIEQVRYPMTHYLMMGMQKQPSPFNPDRWQYGKWRAEDMNITFAQKGQDAKKAENIAQVKARLAEFGAGGYLRFLNDKARWTMGDGTMYFGGEVPTDNAFQQTKTAQFFQQFFSKNGNFYSLTAHWLQGAWMAVLFLCFLPLFEKSHFYADPAGAAARLSVFGLFAFLMLSESRGRYLINYLPLFLVVAALALPAALKQILKSEQ